MKLDAKGIRHLSVEDWRVLAAVEQGSRNHEIVPTPLIISLTNLRAGSAITRSISTLAKLNLIAKVRGAKYDGYRLTYGGLDYSALHSHLRSDTIYSVGNQIGVGKESDIIVVASQGGRRLVLKIHRLGRISFRTVKANRDYLKNRSGGSWMYMSRLAALKEYTFMRALRDAGFPVPEPVAQNRHTVVMELIDAFPLRQISSIPDPAELYGRLIDMIIDLAKYGLIHGDFNEFNILIVEQEEATAQKPAATIPSSVTYAEQPDLQASIASADQATHEAGTVDQTSAPTNTPSIKLTPILIDFPQMLSIQHANAEFYFDRDVGCIKRFFSRRFGFTSDEEGPFFADAMKTAEDWKLAGGRRLDIEVEASGFSKAMAKELEGYMKEVGVDGDNDGEEGEDVEVRADGEEADDASESSPDQSHEDTADSHPATDSTVEDPSASFAAGLEALELEPQQDTVPDLPSLSVAPKAPARKAESVFSSKTSGSRMSRNPAKVATGWAI